MAAFIENIILGRQYTGIEVFSLEGKDRFALLEAKRSKDEITITKSVTPDTIETLATEKANLPTIVVINNSHVLQKEVEGTDPNDRKLLHKAFPNLQLDEFYYETWRKGTVSVIAICRKNYVDQTIALLSKNFTIASVSLGISAISNLMSFTIPHVLTTNTQTLLMDSPNNFVQTGPTTSAVYDINDLTIPNTHLLCFSGVLNLILPGITTGNIPELNGNLLEDFKQKRFFAKVVKAGVGFILGILVVNFFLFTYYFDKAGQTGETIALNKAGIQNMVAIKERIKNKETALAGFINNGASRSAVLLNDIVKAIPPTILLDEISLNPLEKKIKPAEPILVTDNVIMLSGITISNTDFTAWIEQVGKQKHVATVTITSFGKDTEGKTNFSVKLHTK